MHCILYKVNKTIKSNNFEIRIDVNLIPFITAFYCAFVYLRLHKSPFGSSKGELTSNEAVKQALIAGLGYSIMPLIGIRNELTLGQLTISALPDLPLETMWRIVWPKGKKHTVAAEAFKKYLQENMSQIIEKNFGYIDGLTAVPKSMM